jgi:hypothetical protein
MGGASELSVPSRALAARMLKEPIANFAETEWTRDTAQDLRRFLVQQIEAHIDRRLKTPPVLENS